MNKLSNWRKGLMALAVLVVFALALAWLLQRAGQGPTVGQEVSPTDAPLPTKEVSPTATLESQKPVQIVYAVQPPGKAVSLWVLDYDPTTDKVSEQMLTSSPFPDYQWLRVHKVSISPSGQHIALGSRGGAEGFEFGVWVVDMEGTWSQIPPVSRGLSSIFLAWIPSTDRILVQDMDGFVVGTVKLDGTDLQTFSILSAESNPHSAAGGAVSPDGQRIALAIIEKNETWLINRDGVVTREVSFPDKPAGGAAPAYPVWSPDGTKLAYINSTHDDMQQIWAIDVDSEQLKYLSSDDAHNLFPVWSPDSTDLVYIRSETRILDWFEDPIAWDSSLWVAQVETEQYEELVSSEGRACWSPAWLSDGSGIVFVSNRKGQSDVWFVNRDGSGLRQLTERGHVTALDASR